MLKQKNARNIRFSDSMPNALIWWIICCSGIGMCENQASNISSKNVDWSLDPWYEICTLVIPLS